MNRRWTSPPLALQITALLLAGLLVAQLVALALTVLLPPQPPPQYELAGIARALAAGDAGAGHGDSRLLRRVLASGSPEPSGPGWLTSERSRRELAQLLGRDESEVRLYFYTPLPFAGVAGVPGPLPASPRPISSTAPRHRMVRDVQPVPAAAGGFMRVDFQVAQAGGPGAPGGGGFGGGGFGGAGRFGAAGGFGGQGGATGGSSGFGVPGGFGPGGGFSPGPGSMSGPGAGPAGGQAGAFGQPAAGQGGFQPQKPGADRPGFDGPFSVGPVGSAGQANPATPSNQFSLPGADAPASHSAAAGSSAWTGAPAPGFQAQPAAGAFALPSLGAAPHADFGAPGAANASIGRAASSGAGAVSPATPRADAAHRAPSDAAPSIDSRAAATRSTAPAASRGEVPVDAAKAALPTPAATAALAAPGSAAGSADSALTSPAAASKAPASAAAARAPREEKAATQPPVASAERGLFGLAPAPFVVGDFVAAVRLPQGGWATVQPMPEAFPNAWQRRVILWFLIAALIVVPLGWWFSRRIVGPIAGFARAAEQLGRDPRAPVLALAGPAEVGRAAQAFNRMQNQLHSFVEDRTAMIGAISHDLRTPLTRMRFRIEDLPDELRAGMLEDVEEMEQMISSVLAFLRDASEPGAREQLDLSSIVEDVVENANFVGKDVRLEHSEQAAVDVDAIGIRRVLDNLIENAVKYGQIARVRLFVDRQDAVAEISDSGPGLPEEELDRVFQPFYRAPAARASSQRGSGLGLAVCRSIARAHGGDVRLSRGAHGLVAQLRVPLAVHFSTIQ